MIKIAEIEICDACRTVVDGDPSMGDGNTQTACALASEGMARNWPDPTHNVHGAGRSDDDSDGSFSWSACEGCGNPEAGKRYPAVVLGPDNPGDAR